MNKINQLFFAQRLSLLLNSGISMLEALSMMKNLEGSHNGKKVYENIISDIEKGVSLNKSLLNNKVNNGVRFNPILITLIKNGESSGHLSEALLQAYHYLEKKEEMKKKLISSLIYPLFIVLATLAMTLFLILYIFPKIIPLLGSLNIKLPLITRIVQGVYNLSISYGLWFLVSVVMIGIFFHLILKKFTRLRYILHSFYLSIPILNSHIKIYLMASVCSMGEMLLSSGRGLPEMITFSKESSRNLVYKKIFNEIHTESIQGVSFSSSLKKYSRYFPPLLSDMCVVGERTGNLDLMLGHCARIFSQDMDNAIKRFSSLIEPLLMVLMGLIVGSIALSIILPVYEITNHLTK